MVQLPPLREPDTEKPVRVRAFSPLGYYPQHPIAIPGAQLLVREELIVSAVHVEPPEAHGLGDEHFSELEFLALEEMRFLAGIALAVHPDDGMAYTYPLYGHTAVDVGLDDDALFAAAQQLPTQWRGRCAVLPPISSGHAYQWRDTELNVARVSDVVCGTQLNDHLLMRGLGALLRADMCWQHFEIAEAAVIQLYIALDASFQMILRLLREDGVPNPTAQDAGALIDEVFNPGIDTGSYFEDYYKDRIKTIHPSSRLGVFAIPPLEADDYYFLRHGMVEVYHWLITKQVLHPA
jgi:hypothetical protein